MDNNQVVNSRLNSTKGGVADSEASASYKDNYCIFRRREAGPLDQIMKH